MPTSPTTRFKFTNENPQTSLPTLGVSSIVARTTKGVFNNPEEVINSIPRFRELYGYEIVPDGTISNIERALATGSSLRISRVAGATNPSKGVARDYDPETGSPSIEEALLTLTAYDSTDDTLPAVNFVLGIQTREMGSSIVNPSVQGSNANFFVAITSIKQGDIVKYYVVQFTKYNDDDTINTSTILNQTLLLTTCTADSTNPFVDVSPLRNFIENSVNIELKFVSSTDTNVKSLQDVVNYLNIHNNYIGKIDTTVVPDASGYSKIKDYIINEGSNGGDSDSTTWLEAFEATRYFEDTYQLVLSHIHQHLPLDFIATYKQVADISTVDFENVLYVEIPKYNADGVPATAAEILALTQTIMPVIGYNKAIAYFCNGVKLYDSDGNLQNCDVLGTVLGLGDTSASDYGPYYSFAGMNRGLIPDAKGPVGPNLGAAPMYNTINQLAEAKLNLTVIKQTPNVGKRTMLWHSFTSVLLDNSDKFLSSVRLQLYLKKVIRPLIDKQHEEPNYIPTWKTIYLDVKPIMDKLLNIGFSEYEWIGDQDATGYSDMQVNQETDVRNGIYKAKARYTDIVTMQIVEIEFISNSVTREITIT